MVVMRLIDRFEEPIDAILAGPVDRQVVYLLEPVGLHVAEPHDLPLARRERATASRPSWIKGARSTRRLAVDFSVGRHAAGHGGDVARAGVAVGLPGRAALRPRRRPPPAFSPHSRGGTLPPTAWLGNHFSSKIHIFRLCFFAASRQMVKSRNQPGPSQSGCGRLSVVKQPLPPSATLATSSSSRSLVSVAVQTEQRPEHPPRLDRQLAKLPLQPARVILPRSHGQRENARGNKQTRRP